VMIRKQSDVFEYQVTWHQYNNNDSIILVEDHGEELR